MNYQGYMDYVDCNSGRLLFVGLLTITLVCGIIWVCLGLCVGDGISRLD